MGGRKEVEGGDVASPFNSLGFLFLWSGSDLLSRLRSDLDGFRGGTGEANDHPGALLLLGDGCAAEPVAAEGHEEGEHESEAEHIQHHQAPVELRLLAVVIIVVVVLGVGHVTGLHLVHVNLEVGAADANPRDLHTHVVGLLPRHVVRLEVRTSALPEDTPVGGLLVRGQHDAAAGGVALRGDLGGTGVPRVLVVGALTAHVLRVGLVHLGALGHALVAVVVLTALVVVAHALVAVPAVPVVLAVLVVVVVAHATVVAPVLAVTVVVPVVVPELVPLVPLRLRRDGLGLAHRRRLNTVLPLLGPHPLLVVGAVHVTRRARAAAPRPERGVVTPRPPRRLALLGGDVPRVLQSLDLLGRGLLHHVASNDEGEDEEDDGEDELDAGHDGAPGRRPRAAAEAVAAEDGAKGTIDTAAGRTEARLLVVLLGPRQRRRRLRHVLRQGRGRHGRRHRRALNRLLRRVEFVHRLLLLLRHHPRQHYTFFLRTNKVQK
eukprot:Hpha_TRINITY_DN16841_c2_g1::TRINITY_DN16841_c2_g1_i1::g.149349::m.149349